MSPNVIKRDALQQFFVREESSGTEAASFQSMHRQVDDLERELQEAKAREDRRVREIETTLKAELEARHAAEWGQASAALAKAAQALGEFSEGAREVATEEILDLVVAIAEKFLRREISRDDEYLKKLVTRSLHKIVQKSEVTVRVHPKDHEKASEAIQEIAGDAGTQHVLAVSSDPRVPEGGCILDTPSFLVDATLKSQLDEARRVMEGV